jgi:DNA-binding transcriptional ArsR family regulator
VIVATRCAKGLTPQTTHEIYSHMSIYSHDSLDDVFHALSDHTRRGMLALLARGDRSATELGQPFPVSQPTASKHIRTLERSGLVHRTIEGRVHKFRLVPTRLARAGAWIARHRAFWDGSLQSLDEVVAKLKAEVKQ